MGVSIFKKTCKTGQGPAPNPDPARWEIHWIWKKRHGHVLLVRYHDCTNFEGDKVLVFRGQYKERTRLAPHFSTAPDSPFARFIPTKEGIKAAIKLAESFGPLQSNKP